MKRDLFWTFSAITLVLGLVGCASDPPLLTSEGKAGWVTEIYTVGQLPPTPSSCVAALPKEQILAGQFVNVSVAHGRTRRYVTAFAPSGMKLAVDERVEIFPVTCKDGKMPTVQQILSRQ
jgi:hypothetical protein